MNETRKKLCHGLFYLAIFIFLFVWFTKVHALVVFDADDWSYLAYVRDTTPVWGEWNPAKVFPEVVFPFFSTVAAYLVMPLTKDYITAQTLMHALVVSLSITGYLWCFSRLLRRCFPVSRLTASVVTCLFLLVHFLALRSADSGNQYLFYCVDLNCYYNYLLPALLNASLVMSLIHNPRIADFLKSGAPAARGCFYIVVYFAIFSNLPASGILAAWAGSVVLLSLIAHWKAKQWKNIVSENSFPLLVLAAWLISAIFELSGGRAASAGGSASLYHQLYRACKYLARILLDLNRLYQLTLALILVCFVVCVLAGRKKDKALPCPGLGVVLIAAAAFGVYLLMLSSAVGPTAIRRSENLFGLFFFADLCAMLMLTALVSRYPRLMLALPLVTVFLLSGADTRENTFLESNFAGVRPAICADVSRDLIVQLQTADALGRTEVELHVPQYVADPDTEDNWPHSLNLLERLPGTLYSHGLIRHQMHVTPVADPEMNVRFGLPLPQK